MRPTRTAARANDRTRLGALRQDVVFGGSQTLRGKSRSNFLDAPRIGELGLYAKSGIARLALPALRVNQRIITFDAAVVSGDTSRACYSLSRGAALRTKIGPDEAESEGCGGSTVEDDNEVWPDLRRNPEGWGQFSPFRRHSSLEDTPYSSLLASRTEKNWLPAPPVGK
jgi:hypothetical protein